MQLSAIELGSVTSTTCLALLFSVFTSLQWQIIQGDVVSPNVTFPAVFVFGDSIVDTGNNNYLVSVAKSNFPPYGRDFPERKATGRFCNGRVPSDFLAENLGVKNLLPPYLDPNLQIEDLLTGVNFASAGGAFDIVTPAVLSAIPLSDQLKMFKEYIEKVEAAVGEEKTAALISESMYMLCAGSNDLAGYFITTARQFTYDITEYTTLMVQLASTFIQELHALGVRNIGIVNTPPVGCVPFQRTIGGGVDRGCSEKLNVGAKLFNAKLSSELESLQNKLPTATLVLLEVYHPLLDIIQRPHVYGFEEVMRGCCGTGNVELSILCNDLTPFTCSDVSNYVFWDSYHPTEKAYKILMDAVTQDIIKKFS
ncbi:PREDICTED: GDSL esterase/lipase EXL3-like [Nelumbo nucifera]|uniref:GDSL esterase/lipase EXL3-like n=1 Tax=Nelumbo nucifera TaxID=4432 RepID=A0A1U8AUI7_NELNU|nr:PREDICTED: GDSL esterase/lipase EXL3-like [Nelumbo nucifera]